MNLSLTDDQELLRDAVRRFLASNSPASEVRRLMETPDGYATSAWQRMARELALPGIQIPEEYGGQGFSFVELGIVLEEMGRALLCAPFFGTVVLAANAIMNIATEDEMAELLPPIASGDKLAALAFTEESGDWSSSGVTAIAVPDDDGYRIDGVKTYVIDGHCADVVIVVARARGTTGDDGIGFYVVDPAGAGVDRVPLPTLDQTRKQARIELHHAPARRIGAERNGGAALRATLQQAVVALANESVGCAEKLLEMSVEYAKSRFQFGRPIGSFQAIKHKCADMLIEIEGAKSAAYYARWAAAEDIAELPLAASVAKAYCAEACFRAAAETIQIHGGLGFTWEHDAHLYFRRAKSSEVLLGDPTYHRRLVAKYVGL